MTDFAIINRLRALIAALDRRRPRPERAGEAAILRDAAVLRTQATDRLADVERRVATVRTGSLSLVEDAGD